MKQAHYIPGIKLKQISHKDLRFLLKIRNQNRNFFLDSRRLSFKTHKILYENYLKKKDDKMYILMDGRKKIGTGAIIDIDKKLRKAELVRINIRKKFQGSYYGRILLEKLEEKALNEFKLNSLYLKVINGNQRAINLYEKFGFKKKRIGKIKDKELVFMSKTIR